MQLTRRQFALFSLLLLKFPLDTTWANPNTLDEVSLQRILAEFNELEGLIPLATAFLKQESQLNNLDVLREKLLEAVNVPPSAANWLLSIQAQSMLDFESQQTVELDGWILSNTETLFYAWLYLTLKTIQHPAMQQKVP